MLVQANLIRNAILISVTLLSQNTNVLATTITDTISPGSSVEFYWTEKGLQSDSDYKLSSIYYYRTVKDANNKTNRVNLVSDPTKTIKGGETFSDTNNNPYLKEYSFTTNDPNVTDFHQKVTITGPFGEKTSVVTAANIRKHSPWEFEPLSVLPDVAWKIPDIASSVKTIYTAVNLDLYLKENPSGFLNGAWSIDQNLSDLDVVITNGQISGIQGIYWATSEWLFDSDPLGIGFRPSGGIETLLNSSAIETTIIGNHASVPIPATAWLFGSSIAYFSIRSKKRSLLRNS